MPRYEMSVEFLFKLWNNIANKDDNANKILKLFSSFFCHRVDSVCDILAQL